MQENFSSSANEILETILNALDKFRETVKIEDDITLVVIKTEN
jgi:serine phosphatase RsbU (regulator of sigma subunit)